MSVERQGWLVWLLAGLLLVAALGGFAFYRPLDSAAPVVAPIEPTPPPPTLNPLPGVRKTFLVIGADNAEGEIGRADSLAVVSYDSRTQRLAMLSIPRDTWTQIPGHGYDKINHAYAYGGARLAVDTVERLLGIDIHHYITLSFGGFTKMIDAVGGVEITVDKRLYYVDPVDYRSGPDGLVIDINPGRQVMDGLTALKYARFRADEEGDIGRMRRQQQVIKALMAKTATPAVLPRVPQLVPALASTVGTDLSVADMLRLAATGREALAGGLVTGALGGENGSIDGIYYLFPDLVASRALAYEVLVGSPPDEEFRRRAQQEQDRYQLALRDARERQAVVIASASPAPPVSPATPPAAEQPAAPPAPKAPAITVAVIDASGEGIAREYVQKLRAAGFRVARTAKSPRVLSRTVVLDRGNMPQVEERLKAILPTLSWVNAPDPNAEQVIEIILGRDLLEKKGP